MTHSFPTRRSSDRWLGRDDNGPTPLTGATGALQVWTDFMRKADPLPLDMPMPENVVQAWVDARTGQGSDSSCPGAVQMPYIRGSAPAPGLACGIQAPVASVMAWVREVGGASGRERVCALV